MPREFTAPLSFAQEQLWFLDQMDPGRSTYNLPLALHLSGPLDVEALRAAVTALIRRHETLRTTIDERDGVPVQVVAPEPVDDRPLPVEEAPPGPGEDVTAVIRRLTTAESGAAFDLRHGPLLRPRLFRIDADEHLLTLYTHHIVSDGASLVIIGRDLAQLYWAAVGGTAPDLPELPIQYADYAAWQRGKFTGDGLEAELAHWAGVLAGAAVLDLPTDRPRPAVPSFRGDMVTLDLGGGLLDRLRALSRARRATLYMILLAAFDVVMCRYTGQEDVVVGTATAGRDLPELEGLVGFFTNMVVLRTDLSGDPTFAELLDRVKRVTLDAYAHQELPFEKVVGRVVTHRDPSRNPLFQVAIGLLAAEPESTEDAAEGSPLTMAALTRGSGGSRFDIAINMEEIGDALRIMVEYATDLFDRSRIERMIGHFERVLGAAAADPTLRVSQLPLLTDDELGQVLHEWQGPRVEVREVPIHQLIAERAAAAPAAVAAVCAGEELSYAELDRRSGLLARYLRSRGVGREDVVGVALDRGVEVPVALLGVLRAGGAFLAVDPAHPASRVDYMLRDAGVRLVVTRTALVGGLPAAEDRELVRLDEVWPAAVGLAAEPLPELADAGSAAYVLYTSGSTGRPKGVVIEHRGLCTFTTWMSGVFGIGPGSRMLQFASLVFDLAEGEIFTALTRGATLVLVPEEITLSPPALSALIREQRCTYVGAAPAMLGLVDADGHPELRGVLVGGEAFSGDLVNRWNTPGRTFVNGYGPTEVTIGCCYYVCDHITWRSSPPIGRAMPNRTAYLVDRWDNPVPVGVPGELIVGGDGLARGYLGQPELTEQRFVPDPFAPGGRVYRTGDLAVWTEQGQIQFLGRIDTQVKLRGQRIELEEIEAVLAAHPRVTHAVVALREGAAGGKRLVGYVVADGGGPPALDELREHLGRELPAYMVPAAFVLLDEVPLAPTGKVDRSALPDPDAIAQSSTVDTYRAPRGATEETIAGVFATVLGRPRVGAGDDFFSLGGSSLQVAAVISRVRELTGVTLPMRDVYTTPTVAAVAAALDAAVAGSTGPRGLVLPLRAIGDRAPLFCVPHVFGSSLGYRGLLDHLPANRPLYALEAPGLDDDTPPIDRMPELAAAYLAALRKHRPHGPYVLTGHSMGGVVAWEMALQLRDAGEEVGLILVESNIDLRPPASRSYIAQTYLDILAGVAERESVTLGEVDELAEAEFLQRLFDAMGKAGIADDDLDLVTLRRRFGVFAANARALWAYDPDRALPGRIGLVRSSIASAVPEGMWRDLAPDGLDERVVSGDHYSIWSEPHLTGLGRTLADLLEVP
jgi:amino acid adenylation domain-containing protein